MRTVPTIGCAGKDYHDYQFQYVYQQSQGHSISSSDSTPDNVIGMCRSCGDVYMVEVPRPVRNNPSEEGVTFQSRFWGQPGAAQGSLGGVSLDQDVQSTTTSAPTPPRNNW